MTLQLLHLLALVLTSSTFFGPQPIRIVQAQVVGVDLGSEYIKIASVRRSDGIEIVLNEQTRRKTPHYVGFRGKDRYIGEDAKNLIGRFPDLMLSMLNRLVGVPMSDALSRWYHEEMFFTNQMAPITERSSIGFAIARDPRAAPVFYAIETLLGNVFDYIRSTTALFTGEPCTKQDAVVIVPHFFDMHQRRALSQAASLGNTNVIATMHTTTAIALQYGVQNRGFGNATTHVLVYDMGSSKAEAGVYTFTPPASGAKRAESLGTLTARSIVSDPYIGGRSFDACLARMIADDFQAKSNIDVLSDATTLDARKGITVLMRSASRAKEVLSSNKECPVTVEGITKGRDHSTVARRTDFEKKCAPLFDRAASLARAAIEQSGIAASDLHAFEVHGGGVRIPKLIDTLTETFGRPVQRTLNGDESAVLGAAFHAARVSSTFGVKGFAVNETLPYNISFAFSPKSVSPDSDVKEATPAPKQRVLFTSSGYPTKKSVSVNRTEDFQTTFFDQNGSMQTLKISGVHEALARSGHFAPERDARNSFHIRMETKLDGCGVLGVSSVMLKYKEWRHKELPKVEEEQKTGSEDPEGAESVEAVEQSEAELKKHDIPLQMEWEFFQRRPLTTTEFETERRVLREQETYDAMKRAIAQARNDLEAIIIGYQGESLETLRQTVQITKDQEGNLAATVEEAKEWLYDGDGLCETTPADSFRSRQQEIAAVVDSIRYASEIPVEDEHHNDSQEDTQAASESDNTSAASEDL